MPEALLATVCLLNVLQLDTLPIQILRVLCTLEYINLSQSVAFLCAHSVLDFLFEVQPKGVESLDPNPPSPLHVSLLILPS